MRRKILIFLFGWNIDRNARIGFSIIDSMELIMDSGSNIGGLSFFRGLRSVILRENASIGSLNWVTSSMSKNTLLDKNHGFLLLSNSAAITNRHYIDCNGGVYIGRYSTFAGVRSQIFSHAINLYSGRQRYKKVVIGEYCFLGTNVVLLPGAFLPDNCILSAGSTLGRGFENDMPYGLYVGVPAHREKNLSQDMCYFNRKVGKVDV